MDKKQILSNFRGILDELPSFMESSILPSEYAEKNITLDSSVSSIPGPMDYDETPYMREIVNLFDPFSTARKIAIMGSAQFGKTQGLLVPAICYIIANNPAPTLFLAPDVFLAKEMVDTRLDPAIDSAGLRHLMKPAAKKKRNQRTGDTSISKEFAGGFFRAGGYNSIEKIVRQISVTNIFCDDWDAAPRTHKEHGHLYTLLQKRFNTTRKRMRQAYISTPTTIPSNINDVYLLGDQRKWHMPCPCCGEYIVLEWKTKQIKEPKKDAGIYYEVDKLTKKLDVKSVGYVCQECGEFFNEKHKREMNLKSKWIPTAEPSEEGFFSYHFNNLSAASFMSNWTDAVREWLEIYKNGKENISKLRAFYNQILGLPWEERQITIKKGRLASNVRAYKYGTVPQEKSIEDGNGKIVLITGACDLNGNLEDGRLDWEIIGHSESGSIYSIDHGSIGTYQPGIDKTKAGKNREAWSYKHESEKNNIWDKLQSIIDKVYLTEDGKERTIGMFGVDIGYLDTYAIEFANKNKHKVVTLRGEGGEKFKKKGNDQKWFKPSKQHARSWMLEVDLIKDNLAERIALNWDRNTEIQPAGFINFPNPDVGAKKYTPKYFAEYENEKKVIEENEDGEAIGWVWIRVGKGGKKSTSSPNHFWDCAVYNLAIREIFIQNLFKRMKLRDKNWSDYVELVNRRVK
jgi:phage terminase large subunit GpA-like protein